MIISFASRETELIWSGQRSRKLPGDIQFIALRKLRMLNQARVLSDLRIPPANRLEACAGAGRGNTASASTTNGGFALYGLRME